CFWTQEIKWVAENIAVLESPPMLPVAISILSRKWGKQIRNLSIKLSRLIQSKIIFGKLKKLGLAPTVLSIWKPFDLIFVGRMGEKVALWHLFDEVSRFPGNKNIANFIEEIELENIKRVQLVFAASQKLYDNKKDFHANIHLVPNAGDFNMFNAALTDGLPEPEDLKTIIHPRIVLIGSLGWDLDYDLLEYIADSHPEWSIVLIGLVRSSGNDGVESVLKHPNGYSLGYKPQPDLPAYLKYCDVALMPYKIIGSIIDGYPLKMHEYLAAGLPVVSTAQPAVLPFSSIVGVAGNKVDFVSLIEEALENNYPDKIDERVRVARDNSWEKRIDNMNSLICPFLNGEID
ncbi:MAG: glycosyltransferase, partial [Thermodesulfobacteriota bacterium]